MKIYNYDNNGIFTNESVADESPLEAGVYLIPALATTLKPPSTDSDHVAVFNGEVWNIEAVVSNEPSAEELAQLEAEAEARQQAKIMAQDKLKALGLTVEDLQALGL